MSSWKLLIPGYIFHFGSMGRMIYKLLHGLLETKMIGKKIEKHKTFRCNEIFSQGWLEDLEVCKRQDGGHQLLVNLV
jgi:hypothetical protein